MSNRASSCSSPLTTRDAEACTILSTIAPDRVPARGAHMGQRAATSCTECAAPFRTALVAASVRLRARCDSPLSRRLRQAGCAGAKSRAPRPTRGRRPRPRPVRTSALWRWTHRSRGHRIETCGRDYHYPKSPPPPPRTCAPFARRAATCSCSQAPSRATRPPVPAGRTPWQSSTSGLAALRLYRQRYALTPCPALC